MQSFLLKTICCILIINVTFCSSCFRSICKARCYFKHSGFDFGYCEKGICKCAPPVIYVFDGIGRDLSDEYIDNSLDNSNVIQNLIPTSSTSAPNTPDENKKNKIWRNIVGKIINNYPFIKEENLKDLKAKIFNNLPDLSNVFIALRNPLETALDEIKKKIPSTSIECNDLLNLLLQQQKKNDAINLNSKDAPIIQTNKPSTQASPLISPTPQIVTLTQAPLLILPTPQIVPSPSTTPKTANRLTISSLRNIVPNKNGVANTLPSTRITGANPNKQQNSHLNRNKLQPKLKNQQTANKEDKTNGELLLELSDETVEYYDTNELSDENVKQNNKHQTTNNNKIDEKLPPAKKEKLDESYVSQSGSGSYYESFEEEKPAVANVAVGIMSNK
ncbi:uncharacterized protein LOC113553766 [Rhopalosiphum maidis]|uniref:uncharacterized protein LOC113553766 n=1 Tax=Rhopalosiphum maidis TaxID=43146 RepID=UPI000EFEFBBC|nr:uncharacterized protein LOC113553766 [Rhopalosiphum maidis]